MYSVVVVDDEPLVLYGVSAILNSRREWFRIVKTFQDGNSAFEFCCENPTDLLLTDIRMPVMDGLVLIEKLRPQCPKMKIVVLSCHEEFDLVHKAFRLGADEYLLKHNLEEKSFFDILMTLLPQKSRLQDHLEEGVDPGSFPSGSGTLGIIGFKHEYGSNLECIPWSPDKEIIRQIIRNNLNEQSGDICFNGPWDEILLFISDDSGSSLKGEFHVRRKFETIRTLLSGYVNRKVFIALERVAGEEVNEAYISVLRILEQKFYQSESCLLSSDDIRELSTRTLHAVFSITGRIRLQEWKITLAAYLEQGKTLSICPSILRSDISYALHHLFYELDEFCGDEQTLFPPLQTEKIYEGISQIDDWKILQLWVERKLEEVQRSLQSLRESQTLSVSVKEYVKSHFPEPMSLPDMASLFNISPSYLSTCFKQETGQSYIKFVNCIRIGHACDLLANTDLSVKEIAYRTGYENPNYFSRLFKKQIGSTISDYRKKIIDSESCSLQEKSEQ